MTPEPADEHLVRRLRAAGCVFAEDEARLLQEAAPPGPGRAALVTRRLAGEPLEHVLGWVAFGGLRVRLDPGVFVPRRRTEVLVRAALAACEARDAVGTARPHRRGGSPVAVDLCCGSGAVGAAVLAARPGVELWASDVDPVAVSCARRNLPADRVVLGDLFDGLPGSVRGRVDVVVANTPYVPTAALDLMTAESRDHEPVGTRDGGPDGLRLLRRVVTESAGWVVPGGVVAVEVGEPQVAAALAAMTGGGMQARVLRADDVDGTAVVGTAPGS